MLEVDRQIKQLLSQSNIEDYNTDSSGNEDCKLPIPEYIFPKQACLMENFYRPDVENFDKDKLLIRYIQITKDIVALLQLYKLNQ